MKVGNACGIISDTINISFEDKPSIELGSDKTICNELQLDATFTGATYKWQNGSTDSMLIAKKPGIYSVEVKNSCGIYKDSIYIKVDQLIDPFIPNIFTPNGDRFNDFF